MPFWLNYARFNDNGGCGYVLRPRSQFDGGGADGHALAAGELADDPESYVDSLEITVMSALQLPKPRAGAGKGVIVDAYVTVSIVGQPVDCQSARTKTVHNNGFKPEWNEKFEFALEQSADAIVVLRIDDENEYTSDALVGWYALPIHALRDGYRIIEPLDRFGEKITLCNLLVHVRRRGRGRLARLEQRCAELLPTIEPDVGPLPSEKLPVSLPVRATGHLFVVTQFEQPTQCLHCNNYVFNEQGVKCRCGFVAHKRCRSLVDQVCVESGSLYRASEKPLEQLRADQLKPNLPPPAPCVVTPPAGTDVAADDADIALLPVMPALSSPSPSPSSSLASSLELAAADHALSNNAQELRSSAPRGSLRRGGMLELHAEAARIVQQQQHQQQKSALAPPPAPVRIYSPPGAEDKT